MPSARAWAWGLDEFIIGDGAEDRSHGGQFAFNGASPVLGSQVGTLYAVRAWQVGARGIVHEVVSGECGTQRAAGIACSRLYSDVVENAFPQEFAVRDTVQCDTSCQAEVPLTGLSSDASTETRDDLLNYLLDRRGKVHLSLSEVR